MKIIFNLVLIFLTLCLSGVALGEEKNDDQIYHPILPVLLGASLITWGVYDLGGDTRESQRNVKILWGGALAASGGIVLYQWGKSKEKNKEITLVPNVNQPKVAFNYRF